MFLWMAMFWGGLIVAMVWPARQFTQNDRGSRERALEILEERYARGESDSDGFETRRQVSFPPMTGHLD